MGVKQIGEVQSIVSRRTALSVLSASPLLVCTMPMPASSGDAHLLTLGRDFDAYAAKLDDAIATRTDVDWPVLHKPGQHGIPSKRQHYAQRQRDLGGRPRVESVVELPTAAN